MIRASLKVLPILNILPSDDQGGFENKTDLVNFLNTYSSSKHINKQTHLSDRNTPTVVALDYTHSHTYIQHKHTVHTYLHTVSRSQDLNADHLLLDGVLLEKPHVRSMQHKGGAR